MSKAGRKEFASSRRKAAPGRHWREVRGIQGKAEELERLDGVTEPRC